MGRTPWVSAVLAYPDAWQRLQTSATVPLADAGPGYRIVRLIRDINIEKGMTHQQLREEARLAIETKQARKGEKAGKGERTDKGGKGGKAKGRGRK